MIVKSIDSVRKYWVKAKRIDSGKWISGYLWRGANHSYITPNNFGIGYDDKSFNVNAVAYEVDVNSICRPLGAELYYTDSKTGSLRIDVLWEGDLIEHRTYDGFLCLSVLKIGEYLHNGSGGEYNSQPSIGVYAEVLKFICPKGLDSYDFKDYHRQVNIMQLDESCRVVGNINDGFDIEAWKKGELNNENHTEKD